MISIFPRPILGATTSHKSIKNKELKKKHLKVRLLVIPSKRDKLLPNLVKGLGDIAAGNLTITPERLKEVDFSDPYFRGVNEILVTGPAGPKIRNIEDLSGKEIYARASSSYYASLQSLNSSLKNFHYGSFH